MIRKISIGVDYKDAMHYTVGQSFNRMTIEAIRQIEARHYEIWVTNDQNEAFLWKAIIDMPCVVERDIHGFS